MRLSNVFPSNCIIATEIVVSTNATSVFESCFGRAHFPKPPAQILAIWLFSDSVTVFDSVWITNLLWKYSSDEKDPHEM